AKLNLFLHITGKRQDGYHNLQTIFQLLNYGDTMHFNKRQDKQIHLTCSIPIPLEQNLVWRAILALQAYAQIAEGIDIQIEKLIPFGGGLGGSSSNASITLVALNQIWQLHLTKDALAKIGQQLGADVPVFIYGHTAWGEGIGNILTPVHMPEDWYVV